MADFGLNVIRKAFAIGERVAPELSGRLAFNLFARTPDPKALSSRGREAVAQANDIMAVGRLYMLTTSYGQVAAYEFTGAGPHAPTVLVLHGWRSRTELMAALIRGLAARNRVISLDLPGHGASPGRTLNMAMAVEAVQVAEARFGSFAAIIGHSFGGAVALNAAVGSIAGMAPIVPGRLVLMAAPEDIPELFRNFGRTVGVGPRTQTAMEAYVLRVAGRPLTDFVGGRQLATLSVPTLIVHAPDDREVNVKNAHAYTAAGPHVELKLYDGLGHRRIVADQGVVADIVAFVSDGARAMAVAGVSPQPVSGP